MAKYVTEFKELEIGKIRFNKGIFETDKTHEIAFLNKIESLKRYRVKRVDKEVSDGKKKT